jgi:hypothetical protein
VTASELNSARRRESGSRDMWQHRSSPQQGGEVRGRGTRGSSGKEVSSGAMGHVVAPEPTSAGRCGPKLQLAWQRVDAHPAPCLYIELVCGAIRSSGCRQRPPGPPRCWDRPSALARIDHRLFCRSTVGSITCNREHDRVN